MSMKIALVDYAFDMTNGQFNATSKARMDVIKTFSTLGQVFSIQQIYIRIPKIRGIIMSIANVLQTLKILKKTNEDYIVFFQYPTCMNAESLIIKMFKHNGSKTGFLIHDIESFRRNTDHTSEISRLNSVDELIVHTPAMKQVLVDCGVKTKMKVIDLFDYYTEDHRPEIKTMLERRQTIAFAGNLDKSIFLKDIHQVLPNNIKLNLYGLPPKTKCFNDNNIVYIDKFSPENVSFIKAGWGLVWDGDSIHTCNGELGAYLRINASHKLSLYIVAGIPVIIWSQSGVADFVKRNKLGIIIDTLEDISDKIQQISDTEYTEIINNVNRIAKKICCGDMLRDTILTV